MNFSLDWLRDKDAKKRATARQKKHRKKEHELSKDYHDDPTTQFGGKSFSQWKKDLKKL